MILSLILILSLTLTVNSHQFHRRVLSQDLDLDPYQQKIRDFFISKSKRTLFISTPQNLTSHPQVMATEETKWEDYEGLCPNTSVTDGVCRIENRTIQFIQSKKFEFDLKGVEFVNSSLICSMDNEMACSFSISFKDKTAKTHLYLSNSSINAKIIAISSPTTELKIDGSSSIETDGRSLSDKGSDSQNRQGASFIGQGGYCGEEAVDNKIYGLFDILPDPSNQFDMRGDYLIGSAGNINPISLKTGGGGHIHINVDSLKLEGAGQQISACGYPRYDSNLTTSEHLQGGSGGYIYLNTSNVFGENVFEFDARILAVGGKGYNKGYGGSGGIIFFDGQIEGGFYNGFADGGKGGEEYQGAECSVGAQGTIYWKKHDLLYLNNEISESSRHTFIEAKIRDPKLYPNQHMVAEYLFIGEKSAITIKNFHLNEILFPTFVILKDAKLIFDLQATTHLTIKYRDNFQGPSSSFIDLRSVETKVRFESVQMNHDQTSIHLGKVHFSGWFKIDQVHDLRLSNELLDPTVLTTNKGKDHGRIELLADQIELSGSAKLLGGKIVIFANETITITEQSQIESTLGFECTETGLPDFDLFKCVDSDFQQDRLNTTSLLEIYNKQFDFEEDNVFYGRRISNTLDYIEKGWNVYIFSLGYIAVTNSKIRGPRIGMCSNDLRLASSIIDSSQLGCPADRGIGKGEKIPQCAGSGASHGGRGGAGGSVERDTSLDCLKGAPDPYYFGKRDSRYEGSGGGSGDSQKKTGGAGGGVVWLSGVQFVQLFDSKVLAEGQAGRVDNYDQEGSGGGSGGSIEITTLELSGNGEISVRGGDGSPNEGGGGSGGRFVMSYIRSYKSLNYPYLSYGWNGIVNIQGGSAGVIRNFFIDPFPGDNGTMVGPKCLPGYSGVFCQACPVGTYKSEYSYGQCSVCQNKPVNSQYTRTAQSSSKCEYECLNLAINKKAKLNPDCLDPISLEAQRIGGAAPFFLTLVFYLFFALFIFIAISVSTQNMKDIAKSNPARVYQVWEDHDESKRGDTTITDFSLKDSNVWSHTHRMYFLGKNTIGNPWIIPKDFPVDSLEPNHKAKLIQFIDTYNQSLTYSRLETILLRSCSIFLRPVLYWVEKYMRLIKAKDLQIKLYESFDPLFWSDQGDNKSIRLTIANDGYHTAWIDFIDFKKTQEKWQGVKIPTNVMCTGIGTFDSPFRVDYDNDPLLKQLVLIKQNFLKDKLAIFFDNFNSQIGKLSFFKMEQSILRDMSKTVRWLENSNKSLFNHFGVNLQLFITETYFKQIDTDSKQQSRKAFPLETIFFEAFPEMYSRLIRYIRLKAIKGHSEIRLILRVNSYDKKKQVATILRLETMENSEKSSKYLLAVDRNESILFDELDSVHDEYKIEFIRETVDEKQYLPRITEQTEIDAPPSQSHSYVDDSISAFELTIESQKRFEIAIRKSMKNQKLSSIRATIHSLYLLFLKNYGQPSEKKAIDGLLIVFSLLISLDYFFLFSISLDIFSPVEGYENFNDFGWIFFLVYFGSPYIAPVLGVIAAMRKSEELMRLMVNLNAITVVFNVQLSILGCLIRRSDPVYILTFLLYALMKISISIVSGKVRHYIQNPNFKSNYDKLVKIMRIQKEKKKQLEMALGIKAINEDELPEVVKTPDGRQVFMMEDESSQIGSKLRDKLLE